MSRYRCTRKAVLAQLGTLAFVSAAIGNASADPSTAATNLDVLAGSWRGSGAMLFEDGTTENITCNGYYRASPNTSVVFRCKGPATNFELRSKLLKSEGDKVSGVWEERTYNVTGEASGTATAGKLNVRFSGSLEGSIDMSFSPSSQSVSVSIDTKGTGIKGAQISFNRI